MDEETELSLSLVPTERMLWFNGEFLTACAFTPTAMDCLGLYCNGWEL